MYLFSFVSYTKCLLICHNFKVSGVNIQVRLCHLVVC